MTVKGTDTPVQVSSSDFYVGSDGTLRTRAAVASSSVAAAQAQRRRLLATTTETITTSSDGAMLANISGVAPSDLPFVEPIMMSSNAAQFMSSDGAAAPPTAPDAVLQVGIALSAMGL